MNKKAKNKSVPCFDMQFITSSISTTLVLLLLGLVVFFVLGAQSNGAASRVSISRLILASRAIVPSSAPLYSVMKILESE